MSDSLDSTPEHTQPDDYRSGVVAVVGRPNVGKSTLINAILGQKIAAVSPKPQTTRKTQFGIYTTDTVQILFIDTPGIHLPRHKLGEYMVQVATQALRDADVILWVIDTTEAPGKGEQAIAETIASVQTPVVLALNKVDALAPDADLAAHLALTPHVEAHRISALTGEGVPALVEALAVRMPEGPQYYPEDQVTEVNLRAIASEVVREKVMSNTEEEIPHATAVEITEYREREDGTHYISATIYVERQSQKGIIIGQKGQMIKKIGTEARQDLVAIVDGPVYLDLHVSVLKNWRSDPRAMQRFGYRVQKDKE
ncbi:MAG: GTPase Era [Chloroflexi bacterium]|nr:GTPase Era [Chloroflexota bacterium]